MLSKCFGNLISSCKTNILWIFFLCGANLYEIIVDIYKKLATVVEGDPKDPFLITTTPKYRGGRYT